MRFTSLRRWKRSSGPIRARLYLHRTQSTLASGRVVSCTKPRLTIHTRAEQHPWSTHDELAPSERVSEAGPT
jgi:hypothetical protein